MDVDVLITGMTNEPSVFTKNGKLFVNPGSASGAFSTTKAYALCSLQHDFLTQYRPSPFSNLSHRFTTPSFIVLEVRQRKVTVYIYRSTEDKVKVEKASFDL